MASSSSSAMDTGVEVSEQENFLPPRPVSQDDRRLPIRRTDSQDDQLAGGHEFAASYEFSILEALRKAVANVRSLSAFDQDGIPSASDSSALAELRKACQGVQTALPDKAPPRAKLSGISKKAAPRAAKVPGHHRVTLDKNRLACHAAQSVQRLTLAERSDARLVGRRVSVPCHPRALACPAGCAGVAREGIIRAVADGRCQIELCDERPGSAAALAGSFGGLALGEAAGGGTSRAPPLFNFQQSGEQTTPELSAWARLSAEQEQRRHQQQKAEVSFETWRVRKWLLPEVDALAQALAGM